ncbi:MAG: hypothetical protein Q4C30_08860, partial [Bacteroidia bacterium]|nr:hypothetical protein [Bacteroidia bacterium]
MNRLKTICLGRMLALAALVVQSVSAFAQTPTTLYAKNSGDWDDKDNWTTDASGQVWVNDAGLVPGRVADEYYNVTIHAGKIIDLLVKDVDGEDNTKDYVYINKLTLNGELNITQTGDRKVIIKEIVGKGKLTVNTIAVFHMYGDNMGILFDLSTFKGTMNLDAPGDEMPYGNPFLFIPGATEEQKNKHYPSLTVTNGKFYFGGNYYIDGDLVIEPGGELVVYNNVTLTVKGNIINRGIIRSTNPDKGDLKVSTQNEELVELGLKDGEEHGKIICYGNFDNSAGVAEFWKYSLKADGAFDEKKANSVITEFVGGKDSELILNPTLVGGLPQNWFFRIVCNKDNNAATRVYASGIEGKADVVALAAHMNENDGHTFRQIPIVPEKGVLDLGPGVSFSLENINAKNWWAAIAPEKNGYTIGTGQANDVLQLSKMEHTQGAVYVGQEATLAISGADINIGVDNPIFVAGQLLINSGSFRSGSPGIFYCFPIIEDANTIDKNSEASSRMTLKGGELHTARQITLNTSGKVRPAVHFQFGGKMCFDVKAKAWSRGADDLTNKTVYLGKGSQFVMHDGELHVMYDAVQGKATKKIFDQDVQFVMADIEDGKDGSNVLDPNTHPVSINNFVDGGTIYVDKPADGQTHKILSMMASCHNAVIESGADLTMLPVGGLTFNGDLTVKGKMTPQNDVHIKGNFEVTGTFAGTENYNLYLEGSKNATYNANGVTWKNLEVAKELGGRVAVKDGTTLNIKGNILGTSGKLIGSVTLPSGAVTNFTDNTDKNEALEDVDLTISTTNGPTMGSDIVLRNVKFTVNSKFQLGYHGLKIKNYPTGGSWSASRGFEVPKENTVSAKGLTLPVPQAEDGNKLFPMIVDGKWTTVQVMYTPKHIGSEGYVTVIPVHAKHPALWNDSALKCYWIIYCNVDRRYDGSYDLYECRNFETSDNLGSGVKRQIIFCVDGSKRGNKLSYRTYNDGEYITYSKKDGSIERLSGEFSGGNSTQANDNYTYYSQKDGKWQDKIWKRKITGGNFQNPYYDGSSITSQYEVTVDHEVTFVDDTKTTYNAGVITINNKLIV